MKETHPYKLGRKIAENILDTGVLFYKRNMKANFFRGLVQGLMKHEWICQIIKEEQKYTDKLKFKNHCYPKPGQILDGERAFCKQRCDEEHRKDCREVYNK